MDITPNSNTRPLAIKLAVMLLALVAGAATIEENFYSPWGTATSSFIFGFNLVLDFVPLWFVFRRKNWARWFLAIFTFAGIWCAPSLWARSHQTFSAFQSTWFWLSDLLNIIALVLLFLPSSNRWFHGRKLSPGTILSIGLWMVAFFAFQIVIFAVGVVLLAPPSQAMPWSDQETQVIMLLDRLGFCGFPWLALMLGIHGKLPGTQGKKPGADPVPGTA
jgi:hypothetical protein